MSGPIISVLIPVYNSSEFLYDSIPTVLNQTFKDIELVIVDDGSTDNSLEILEDFAKKDGRIKIFTKENGGSASSRNMALKQASGKYIAFFDPDDYMSPNLLELAYDNITRNNTDMVMFKGDLFNEDGNIIENMGFNKLDYDIKIKDYENFTFNYLDFKPWVLNRDFAPWGKVYKKEFLDSYDDFVFDEGVAFEDVPFHIKAMLRAKDISFVNEFLYHWRSDNPKSVSKTPEFCYDIFKIMDIIYELLNREGIYEEFELEYNIFQIGHGFTYILWVNSEDYFSIIKDRVSKIKIEFVNEMNEKLRNQHKLIVTSENLEDFKLNSISYYSNKIVDLNNKVNSLQRDKSKLKSKLKKLKKENDKLKSDMGKLMDDNNESKKELKKSQDLDDKSVSSKSWKLTQSLRKMTNRKK